MLYLGINLDSNVVDEDMHVFIYIQIFIDMIYNN